MAMKDSLAGKLLVASPLLVDPNFHRAVVLVCAHDEGGALGLILNRPVEDALVSDHLPEWTDAAAPPAVLFRGGPVEPGTALALARSSGGEPPVAWTPVAHRAGLIDISRGPAELAPMIDTLRIFGGYAGWGASQLAEEIAEKAWFTVESWPSDLFTSEPEALWKHVLRRQGGDLALVAHYPDDPSLN